MKTPLLLLLAAGASLALTSTLARADGKAACFEAASKGQSLRDAHRLIEAREELRVCARRECPAMVAKDCASWLDAVEQGLPTVVISATDGAGHDLLDVKVTLDDKPFATRLDGSATPVDPGPHKLHFEGPDGTQLDQHVVMREGVKNQNIAVVLGQASPAAPLVAAPPTAAPATVPPAPAPPPPEKSGPLRTVGWVVGAVGVAGLGLGTGFGVKAISDKNGAQCDPSGACQPGPLADARTSATVSTVGLVAGGVLLAAGAAFVLFAPRTRRAEAATLTVSPTVGGRDAGVVLGGVW